MTMVIPTSICPTSAFALAMSTWRSVSGTNWTMTGTGRSESGGRGRGGASSEGEQADSGDEGTWKARHGALLRRASLDRWRCPSRCGGTRPGTVIRTLRRPQYPDAWLLPQYTPRVNGEFLSHQFAFIIYIKNI